MKRILFILLVPILMSSCASTFFYSTISSLSRDLLQTDTGDFVSENDSLLVAYWFNGENAPIFINIYNKSNHPLYVDWNRSSIIMGNEAKSYRNRLVNLSNGDERSFLLSETISFIPPMSRKTFNTHCLSNFDYGDMKNQYFKKTSIPNKSGLPVEVKQLEFSRNTTPLRFKSYLSFYTSDRSKPFSTEHEFYISKLIKTNKMSPSSMPEDLATRGDLFYIEKISKNRTFGEAFLGTTLFVGLLAADLVLSDEE